MVAASTKATIASLAENGATHAGPSGHKRQRVLGKQGEALVLLLRSFRPFLARLAQDISRHYIGSIQGTSSVHLAPEVGAQGA
jgi:hypothetical protein